MCLSLCLSFTLKCIVKLCMYFIFFSSSTLFKINVFLMKQENSTDINCAMRMSSRRNNSRALFQSDKGLPIPQNLTKLSFFGTLAPVECIVWQYLYINGKVLCIVDNVNRQYFVFLLYRTFWSDVSAAMLVKHAT